MENLWQLVMQQRLTNTPGTKHTLTYFTFGEREFVNYVTDTEMIRSDFVSWKLLGRLDFGSCAR